MITLPHGTDIYLDKYAPNYEWKQFRFPRTKKRRIRKKWSRNGLNYRNFPIFKVWNIAGLRYFCNQVTYDQIQEQLKPTKERKGDES